jgi:hypothetical protein
MARHLSPQNISRILVAGIACESPKSVAPACFDPTSASAWLHSLMRGVGASHVIGGLRTTDVEFVIRKKLIARVVAGAIIVI